MATLLLVRHNFALMRREPGPVISRLLQPLVLITLMRPLYVAALSRRAGTIQVVTGVQVMFSMLALSVVGTAILTERTWRTWDRIRATGARPGDMLAGKAVPALAMLAVQQAVVLGFGVVAFGVRIANAGLAVAAITCWVLALLGIGGALGAWLRSQSELNVAYDIGGVLLSALGGALVPLTSLPGWARAIAPGSPGYWAMAALRSAIAGQAVGTLRACGVLLAVAAVFAAIATWRINRGWARSRFL